MYLTGSSIILHSVLKPFVKMGFPAFLFTKGWFTSLSLSPSSLQELCVVTVQDKDKSLVQIMNVEFSQDEGWAKPQLFQKYHSYFCLDKLN